MRPHAAAQLLAPDRHAISVRDIVVVAGIAHSLVYDGKGRPWASSPKQTISAFLIAHLIWLPFAV